MIVAAIEVVFGLGVLLVASDHMVSGFAVIAAFYVGRFFGWAKTAASTNLKIVDKLIAGLRPDDEKLQSGLDEARNRTFHLVWALEVKFLAEKHGLDSEEIMDEYIGGEYEGASVEPAAQALLARRREASRPPPLPSSLR